MNALGSCVAVIAQDFDRRLGGIAHIMLPGSAPPRAQQPTKYAENGIHQLLDELKSLGAETDELTICLVGAGNVLKRDDDQTCAANIESVQRVLEREGLRVSAARLGGLVRRSCTLDTSNGRVTYTEGDDPIRVLWEDNGSHG